MRALSEIIVGATLLQAGVFTVFLLTDRFRGSLANLFLCAGLVVMAAIKGDQLYQMTGGLSSHPEWGFVLSPLQPLMTPAIFFFVLARTDPGFKLRVRHAAHLIPAALYFMWLWSFYLRFEIAGKTALIEGGALSNPVSVFFIPAATDLLQLGYIGAAYIVLSRRGVALRRWFSRVDDKNLAWMKELLGLWAAVFLLHLFWTFGARAAGLASAGGEIMLALNGAHFLFINLLLMLAIVDFAVRPVPVAAPVKYAGSLQTPPERTVLYKRAEALLGGQPLYLDPDLSLQTLADALGATARELSEALNGEGGQSFYSFINGRRVEAAKENLIADPSARILDIALASGFNSKSAFNETFRRVAGMTPSEWRKRESERTPLHRPAPSAR